jgi:hypothetical protein
MCGKAEHLSIVAEGISLKMRKPMSQLKSIISEEDLS